MPTPPDNGDKSAPAEYLAKPGSTTPNNAKGKGRRPSGVVPSRPAKAVTNIGKDKRTQRDKADKQSAKKHLVPKTGTENATSLVVICVLLVLIVSAIAFKKRWV
ncbi:LPXTG cell wall anchor domain-containing protein [Lactobacillus sp. XV13L]|nr:LPXTG cell wall anchor domain-containing protein [Lactobacillus sp. XV13L]